MPLVANVLEMQLNALSQKELSIEDANKEFAQIITDYIKTATVDTTGAGYQGFVVNSKGKLS
ncbi:MAG: hypothetical protein ACRC0X_09365 [Brevinema sp.]